MITTRRVLGTSAGVLGALAAIAGRPSPNAPTTIDVAALAREIDGQTDHVSALELAGWIRDRRPGLRVLDVRSAAEFETYHIPSAEHVPLATLAAMRPRAGETLVLYSEGGAHAGQAWVLLRALGFRDVYFLAGGLLDWMEDVMRPAVAAGPDAERVAALSRYFGGTPRSGADVPDESSSAAAVARLRRRGC
ncbi:Rhodanese-like protein (plasmid) [Gemmatirosa kalamazoonensis]|uniref:Rhodanese-like protein n=1 Tax=Gemmatirosa kalamazoonensis TaxID=861299 RepID=W0RNY9_9BACT|nr:rhodanese-like domain-containing protein [Gemmatirosa kalamazoonensis]AHG92461.1 Rhodanese-like protein [Gemmatirosa kalamazoonensis]